MPDEVVAESLGDDADVEEFWQQAGDNLRAGKVRMVFVTDEIPRELRRVVEFLNGQMNPAEVIAIEVKQYVGPDGTRTLVPRVIGQTAEVEARKGGARPASAPVGRAVVLRRARRETRRQKRRRPRATSYDWTSSAAGVPLSGPARWTAPGSRSSRLSGASTTRSRSTPTADRDPVPISRRPPSTTRNPPRTAPPRERDPGSRTRERRSQSDRKSLSASSPQPSRARATQARAQWVEKAASEAHP